MHGDRPGQIRDPYVAPVERQAVGIAAGETGGLPRVIGTEPADAEARGGRPNVLPVKISG